MSSMGRTLRELFSAGEGAPVSEAEAGKIDLRPQGPRDRRAVADVTVEGQPPTPQVVVETEARRAEREGR